MILFSLDEPNGNILSCFVHLNVITDDMIVAIINTGITHINENYRPGIPNIVASLLGTRTAEAATVSQTISFVNWFVDSV